MARPFTHFTSTGVAWADGTGPQIDVAIWCSGSRPRLDRLVALEVLSEQATVDVEGTRSLKQPRLWLVGMANEPAQSPPS
ncbi:hypothetical protein [Pseudomonas sp. CC6-YY-74]|uniref:hypothetical protein n=1 Tax=Pseudomonas sp. CC6-YY-74 TaxID=1930532 RepID=UPI0012ABDA78|nr:hypothetical protein [Pseudomonas sp. CC6-YY-74]